MRAVTEVFFFSRLHHFRTSKFSTKASSLLGNCSAAALVGEIVINAVKFDAMQIVDNANCSP